MAEPAFGLCDRTADLLMPFRRLTVNFLGGEKVTEP